MINPTKRCSTLLLTMFNIKCTILFAALVTVSEIFPETATVQIGGSGFGHFVIPFQNPKFPETQPAPKNSRPQQKSQIHSRRKSTLSRRAK